MENSAIEWTDNTFNPWWGCVKVSAACAHCYAEAQADRFTPGLWGDGSTRKPMSESYWAQPLIWNKKARAAGVPTKVFCASMADVFEDRPDLEEHRARLWNLIAQTSFLTWQLLTKRPENILRMVPSSWLNQWWPSNVWIGTTIENTEVAPKRLDALCKVPAAVRFLSCEPMLSRLSDCFEQSEMKPYEFTQKIQWVIIGGESGSHARPMHPQDVIDLGEFCDIRGIPFFFKQWGEWAPYLIDGQRLYYGPTSPATQMKQITSGNSVATMVRIGKKAAGRSLAPWYGGDISYSQFPRK